MVALRCWARPRPSPLLHVTLTGARLTGIRKRAAHAPRRRPRPAPPPLARKGPPRQGPARGHCTTLGAEPPGCGATGGSPSPLPGGWLAPYRSAPIAPADPPTGGWVALPFRGAPGSATPPLLPDQPQIASFAVRLSEGCEGCHPALLSTLPSLLQESEEVSEHKGEVQEGCMKHPSTSWPCWPKALLRHGNSKGHVLGFV